MTENSSEQKRTMGIIILGNSGVGKSFMCNLLLGEERFKSAFRATSVTTETTSYRLDCSSFDLLIYDIPGLVEAQQKNIDRNISEIRKAFDDCPHSLVIFVWSVTGGRIRDEDVVAFKKLNTSYSFPHESLLFVVNNLPHERDTEYDGSVVVLLSELLDPMPVDIQSLFFLDILQKGDMDATQEARFKLFSFLFQKDATDQQEYTRLILHASELPALKEALKMKEKALLDNETVLQRKLTEIIGELENAKTKQAEKENRYRQEIERNTKVARATGISTGAFLGGLIGLAGGPIGAVVGAAVGGGASAITAKLFQWAFS